MFIHSERALSFYRDSDCDEENGSIPGTTGVAPQMLPFPGMVVVLSLLTAILSVYVQVSS